MVIYSARSAAVTAAVRATRPVILLDVEQNLLNIVDRCGSEIDEILAQIRVLKSGGVPCTQSISRALSRLSRTRSKAPNRYLEILSGRIDDLTAHYGNSGQNRSAQMLSDAISEIRIHFLIAAHSSACSNLHPTELRRLDQAALAAPLDGRQSPVGTVVHLPGGVSYATVETNVVILLPELRGDSEEVLYDLSALYHAMHNSYDWVIDFSAAREIPLLLLSNIVAYRSTLQAEGRKLSICWLSDRLSGQQSIKRLIGRLDLQLIGGHWFSR